MAPKSGDRLPSDDTAESLLAGLSQEAELPNLLDEEFNSRAAAIENDDQFDTDD